MTAGKCGNGAGSPLGVTRTCGSVSASLVAAAKQTHRVTPKKTTPRFI
jgi:hypothetical protein